MRRNTGTRGDVVDVAVGSEDWADSRTPRDVEKGSGLMKEDSKVKNADERKREFEDKVEERKRRETKNKAEKQRSSEEKSGAMEEDGGGLPARSSRSSGIRDDLGGQGEKRKANEVDDLEAERVVGDVEIIDEEFAKVCINEVAKAMDLESAEERYIWGEDGDEFEAMEEEDVLDGREVREARKEEVDYMEGRKIWSIRTVDECWMKMGKAPVSVRWVVVMKALGVRSRLVARDFKGGDKDRDDLFAATPPLEGIRLLLSMAATSPT
jgi:hypothetical protein